MNPDIRRKIAATIESRYREKGYDSINDFYIKSGSMLSGQTFYRLLGDKDFDGVISPQVIIEIAFLAGCTRREIVDMLHSVGDRMWHKLISSSEGITSQESAVLSVCRKVTEKDTSMWDRIASSLEAVCSDASVSAPDDIGKIRGDHRS